MNEKQQIGQKSESLFSETRKKQAFKSLDKRFNKAASSWCERFKSLRSLSFAISWAFNLISAAGLSYLVYHSVKAFNVPHVIAVSFAAVALVLFELLKRKTSDLFWDDFVESQKPNLGLGIINFLIIFGLSLAGTRAGYQQGTRDYSPEYQAQQTNAEIDRINADLAKIEKENEGHRKTADKTGQMRWNNEKMHTANNKRIAELNAQADNARTTLSEINKEHGTEFEKGVTLGIDTVMYIAIGSEIAFEFLMFFMSLFDFRKRIELSIELGIPLDDVIDNTSLYSTTSKTTIKGNLYQSPLSGDHGTQNRAPIGFAIPKKGFTVSPLQTDIQTGVQTAKKSADSRVRHEKHSQTETKQRVKSAEYITKMKSRIRVRWARSHDGQDGAPKSEAMRKTQRELALEEWQELEEMGYKIEILDKKMPWRLTFTPPNR